MLMELFRHKNSQHRCLSAHRGRLIHHQSRSSTDDVKRGRGRPSSCLSDSSTPGIFFPINKKIVLTYRSKITSLVHFQSEPPNYYLLIFRLARFDSIASVGLTITGLDVQCVSLFNTSFDKCVNLRKYVHNINLKSVFQPISM